MSVVSCQEKAGTALDHWEKMRNYFLAQQESHARKNKRVWEAPEQVSTRDTKSTI